MSSTAAPALACASAAPDAETANARSSLAPETEQAGLINATSLLPSPDVARSKHLPLNYGLNASSPQTQPGFALASSPSAASPSSHPRKPSEAGLHLQTQLPATDDVAPPPTDADVPTIAHPIDIRKSRPPPLHATRSYDSTTSAFYSPSSSVSSPALAALSDVTPLPSPLNLSNSPELWRKVVGRPHSGSNASTSSLREEISGFLSATAQSTSPPRKKKTYPALGTSTNTFGLERREDQEHSRTVSEFIPEALSNSRPRTVTVPSLIAKKINAELSPPLEQPLHREVYLAKQRGLSTVDTSKALPTPPLSNASVSDLGEEETQAGQEEHVELLRVRNASQRKTEFWRPLRQLGQGAFSQVVLATRDNASDSGGLVAIKIVSHNRTIGNDEERMETSIKREIEILQSISHACLPRMQAFDDDDKRALLVMNYCPGGDLFDLASQQRDLLKPELIQRIFAELVAAVAYLHGQLIVHRDIKLENILFNIPPAQLCNLTYPLNTHPHPLITLTDLGLSKRIPADPACALLTHPCGSVDYAAPELLLGQSYDGRATDAWALGVLLYALMEGRLPFDPLPVSGEMSAAERRRRQRGQGSTVKHRIARCDWLWCEFGDEDGAWDEARARGLEGAREVVEGLLRKVGRGRWSVENVREAGWVKGGIDVPGGLVVSG